jgi:hypothetical protein
VKDVKSNGCDVAIVDIEAFRLLSSQEYAVVEQLPVSLQSSFMSLQDAHSAYPAIRDLLRSAWGKAHPLIVWTNSSKGEFERRIAEIDQRASARIRFYSKDKLEIPPELDCIRQQILDDPQLIGYDFRKNMPMEVTDKWIKDHPGSYWYFEQYVVDLVVGHVERDKIDVDELPCGFRWVYLIWRCYGSISNGGLQQFLNSALSEDESGKMIIETLNVLRRFEMHVNISATS